MKHIKHTYCDHEERDERCIVCEGGLFLCEVCGGAERALPTDCPGVRLTAEQMDGVGISMDFVDGEWMSLTPYTTCDMVTTEVTS